MIINDYVTDKVLDKIKEIIGVEQFENTKILKTNNKNGCTNMDIHNFKKMF